MSEMALTADHLVVIGRGRLIADIGIGEFQSGRVPTCWCGRTAKTGSPPA